MRSGLEGCDGNRGDEQRTKGAKANTILIESFTSVEVERMEAREGGRAMWARAASWLWLVCLLRATLSGID